MVFQTRFFVDPGLTNVEAIIAERYQRIIDDWSDELAAELQRESPIGATFALAENWEALPAQIDSDNPFSFSGSVVNLLPTASYRVAGRGPGGRPPLGPLLAWARAKGIPEFLIFRIASNIAFSGTERWRTQENFLDLTPEGDLRPGSFVFDRLDDLAQRLSAVVI